MMTSAVATSIQATSPLLGTGADAAGAAADAASAAPEAAVVAAGAVADAASDAAWANAPPAPTNMSRPKRKASRSLFMVLFLYGSERVLAGLAGPDADDLLERRDEDLSVADLAGAGSGFDRFDDPVDDRVVDRGFDLHLGQEVDDVLGAAVELRVPFLPPEPLHFRHRDALHADRAQGLTHFVELERLDDRGHHLHCKSLPGLVIRT